jgi:hypothetical protein
MRLALTCLRWLLSISSGPITPIGPRWRPGSVGCLLLPMWERSSSPRATAAERAELDGLARSTRTEYRLRQRARIVLLAAEGLATRAIARTVGCTTGTASKWLDDEPHLHPAPLDPERNVSDEHGFLRVNRFTGRRAPERPPPGAHTGVVVHDLADAVFGTSAD